MKRKPKVYGGNFFLNGRQVRGIVAGTQKEVAAVTGHSLSFVREMWCETGNDIELKVAQADPGVLFFCEDVYSGRVYKRASEAQK